MIERDVGSDALSHSGTCRGKHEAIPPCWWGSLRVVFYGGRWIYTMVVNSKEKNELWSHRIWVRVLPLSCSLWDLGGLLHLPEARLLIYRAELIHSYIARLLRRCNVTARLTTWGWTGVSGPSLLILPTYTPALAPEGAAESPFLRCCQSPAWGWQTPTNFYTCRQVRFASYGKEDPIIAWAALWKPLVGWLVVLFFIVLNLKTFGNLSFYPIFHLHVLSLCLVFHLQILDIKRSDALIRALIL